MDQAGSVVNIQKLYFQSIDANLDHCLFIFT